MNLLLWRHAHAEDGIPDATRALTRRGQRQAERMAEWLRPRLPTPYLMLVSPATRTRQTAEALHAEYVIEPRLAPGSGLGDCLAAVGWPRGPRAGIDTALVVGHQPTLGAVAAHLLCGADAAWSVRKGGLWWLVGRERHGEFQVTLRCVLPAELI